VPVDQPPARWPQNRANGFHGEIARSVTHCFEFAAQRPGSCSSWARAHGARLKQRMSPRCAGAVAKLFYHVAPLD
jgi:hypothetical protein